MDTIKPLKRWLSYVPFRRLSIKQRLPLLICLLLLCIIITFSWISYQEVRKATLKSGHDRLRSLTDQLSSLFGQSFQNSMTTTRVIAGQDTVRKFLLSGGRDVSLQPLEAIQKLQKDSSSMLVELLDADKAVVLRSGKPGIDIKVNWDSLLAIVSVPPDSCRIGALFQFGDSTYYPIIASVTDNKKIIGHVVRWRILHATPKSIEQLSRLIGTNATLYIGNKNGDLWTDLSKSVTHSPMDMENLNTIFEYSPPHAHPMTASVKPIPNTPWLIFVGMSKHTIMEASDRFLKKIIMLGGILIIIGILAAWVMSRNITHPLNQLTVASSAIASGDYSSSVPVDRTDELGKLARSFNAMTSQVQQAQQGLEKKVQERTAQLEAVNAELGAFSYSVSHDLRAPLRAISCFAMILKEDYGTKLDNEANRITDKIVANVKMMGQLIDDLIAFSQMGTKEIVSNPVNMKTLAESCIAELPTYQSPTKYQVHIASLPSCQGDENLIKQVWINLIGNAIKYSSKKPLPTIEIGGTAGDDLNTYFIRDNGVGFDMKYAHKLFGVFQRLHSEEAFEGTGIGLALAKRIINKHGGEIWGESFPGGGAVFYFNLPTSKNLKGSTRESSHKNN